MSENAEYFELVMDKLTDNPTAQDLDFFIEAHARIGYLAAVARGRADVAEARRKFETATQYGSARASGNAKSASDAEQAAYVAAFPFFEAETKARETSQKLSNLLNSVEQAINGIKFLSRQTDVPMSLPRR